MLLGFSPRRAAAFRFLGATVLLAAAGVAVGQSADWTTRGPWGGSLYCLTQDPSRSSTLYAGTQRGVYKSDDGGATWRFSGVGMPVARVQTIAIDPTAPSTLYAGTVTPNGVESVGIFKSTDGGATWSSINAGLVDPVIGFTPVDVEALAIDPRHPATILAGSRYSEVYKSTDGGTTWQFKTLGGYNVGLQTSAFAFDPNDSTKIYAASTSGILRSTDGGESWGVLGNTVSLFSLVIDPTSSSTLYAGNLTGYGFLKSTDGGAHFNSFNKGLPTSGSSVPEIIAIALDPSKSSTIYSGTYGNGLFASTDAGANWTRSDSGMRSAYASAFAFPPGASSPIRTGTFGGGLYQSADGAKTWTSSSSGLDLSLVYGLALDPSSVNTVYAAAFDGVQKSVDGGGSWQLASSGLPVTPIATVVVSPGNPKTLYAGTLGGGLLKSSDGAASWVASASGLTDSYISSIAVDPSSPMTLYAGTSHLDTSSQRVFKSTDGGVTWTQTSLDAKNSTVDFITINPARTSQVLAGSQGVLGYFQSLDGGRTWSSVSSSNSCGATNALLFDPSGSTLYMAASAGVCRSTDGGATWIPVSVAGYAIMSIAIDPASPSTLYAGASVAISVNASGVFRSTDGGLTWQPIGSAFPPVTVTGLAVDALGKTLHASTFHGGVLELAFPKDRVPVQNAGANHHAQRIKPR